MLIPPLPALPPQVWTFIISNATFKLASTLTSARKDDQEVVVDRIKMVLVDSKLVSTEQA